MSQHDIAPLSGFNVVLVGQFGGDALLTPGAGTITYVATNAVPAETSLASASQLPADSDYLDVLYGFATTAETANSWYSAPKVNSDGSITQAFGVSVFARGGFLAVSADAVTPLQTDVFAINTAGQLAWFTTTDPKRWQGYPPISPPGFKAPAGAPLAVSPQFGAGPQTDVFVADASGSINVFYYQGSGWLQMQPPLTGGGAVAPGAPLAASHRFGAAAGQTDVYAGNKQGQLVCWSVVGGGAWSGPVAISNASSGFSAPQGAFLAASQQFGANNQTDVFVVDATGTLCVFWINGGGDNWNGPHKISGANFAPPGAFIAASPQYGVEGQTTGTSTESCGS